MTMNEHLSRGHNEGGQVLTATPGAHANVSDDMAPETYNRVIQSRADAFRRDEGMEQLLARIAKDPEYANTLSAGTHLQLGYYSDQKTAHEDLNPQD
jgi:hypothetical protein